MSETKVKKAEAKEEGLIIILFLLFLDIAFCIISLLLVHNVYVEGIQEDIIFLHIFGILTGLIFVFAYSLVLASLFSTDFILEIYEY